MKRSPLQLILLIVSIFVLFPSALSAQEELGNVTPSDVFYRGWQIVKSAEKLTKEKKYNEASQKYHEAARHFDTLNRFHSDWQPNIVKARIKSTKEAIAALTPQAIAEQNSAKQQNQDLIEGGIASALDTDKADNLSQNHKKDLANDPYVQNSLRIRQLELENSKLKEKLKEKTKQANESAAAATAATAKKATAAATSAADKASLEVLRNLVKKKDAEITHIRNLLLRAPMQTEVDKLKQQVEAHKKEVAMLATLYKGSKNKLDKTLKTIEQQEADALKNEQEIAKISKDMTDQQEINNSIIDSLRKKQKLTLRQLKNSRTEAANLRTQLESSQSLVAELITERDSLRAERDALDEVLEKNGSEGIRKVIAENMRLGTELKQSEDRLAFLEKSHDSTKSDLVEAKSDLALAKQRLIEAKDKYLSAEQGKDALKTELLTAQKELKNLENQPQGDVNTAEVKLLKSTVNRLITAQNRRATSDKLLWEAYKNAEQPIPGMDNLFKTIHKNEIVLSEEEKALLSSRGPDQEFQNPERVSMEHALAHGNALKSELKYSMSIVVRFFEKGNYLTARQILQDLDQRIPGNTQILCTRGVIELKTHNYAAASELFSEAITMNEESDYAHYMLGVTHYKNQNFDGARNAFERAIAIKPVNEKAHLYLGCIAGMGKRFEQSEEYFQTAIKLKPTYADAYYNLSALYLQQKKRYEALQYYNKALQNGKAPDTALESSIKSLETRIQ